MNRRSAVNVSALLIVSCFLIISEAAAHARTLKAVLPLSRIRTTTVNGKHVTCALFRSRSEFVVAKHVKGNIYKSVSGTRAQRTACAGIDALGEVSLSQLPDGDALVRANSQDDMSSIAAVSGTPPALPEFAMLDIKELFWRPNVVDDLRNGAPNGTDCTEFFNSSVDGLSGGLNACFLTQNIGYSFQTVLDSVTDLCFMKRFPTQTNVDAGAISLVRGSLPSNDITQLFSIPNGAPRVIKINTVSHFGTKEFWLRIYDAGANAREGNNYRFDTWSCRGGQTARHYETARITTGGAYVGTLTNADDMGTGASVVTAFLRREGNALNFDPTRDRTATTIFHSGDNSSQFKSSLSIDPLNIVREKSHDIFGADERKAYTISHISGSTIATLRLLEGAYKELHSRNNVADFLFTTGTEFRDTYYAAAPANSLVSGLSDVDPQTDPFYTSIDDVPVDGTNFSCATTPDIELSIDGENSLMQALSDTCRGGNLFGMNFCNSNSDVQQAASNFGMACGI